MRHLKAGKILGRNASHRKALFNNLVSSLIKHEQIVTTLAKAKELRRRADKVITLAKRGDLNSRRVAFKTIKNKETLIKLFDTLGPRFAKRNGGYTRIYHLGNRNGDAAKMAVLEWVDKETKDKKETKEKETKEKKKTPVKKETKKKAPAKKETKEKKETKVKKEAKEKKETKVKKETKKTKTLKAKKETKKKEGSPKSKSK
ncbi:MAG TPA: 50S ribosomal protein L17 [Nitrospinota bacterium]|jgi:large subunit ribosomal protein L17|nr:50S ribosomal protein L17 [Nitrospinota bacterium]